MVLQRQRCTPQSQQVLEQLLKNRKPESEGSEEQIRKESDGYLGPAVIRSVLTNQEPFRSSETGFSGSAARGLPC